MSSSPKAREWLKFAWEDLSAGRFLLTAPSPYLKKSSYLAQQCVEKTMKAFLVHNKKRVLKTHNMTLLADKCVEVDASLESILVGVEKLDKYVLAARYPDALTEDIESLTLELVQLLLDNAELIFDVFSKRCSEPTSLGF